MTTPFRHSIRHGSFIASTQNRQPIYSLRIALYSYVKRVYYTFFDIECISLSLSPSLKLTLSHSLCIYRKKENIKKKSSTISASRLYNLMATEINAWNLWFFQCCYDIFDAIILHHYAIKIFKEKHSYNQ